MRGQYLRFYEVCEASEGNTQERYLRFLGFRATAEHAAQSRYRCFCCCCQVGRPSRRRPQAANTLIRIAARQRPPSSSIDPRAGRRTELCVYSSSLPSAISRVHHQCACTSGPSLPCGSPTQTASSLNLHSIPATATLVLARIRPPPASGGRKCCGFVDFARRTKMLCRSGICGNYDFA